VLLAAAAAAAAMAVNLAAVKYIRPKLTDYQLAAFFNPARRVMVEGTTKTGKNHAGLAWLCEQAALVAGSFNYWWAEPVYGQAAISYRRLKEAIPIALRKPNDSDMTLTLRNKRVIWFKSGEKSDNLFGEDVGAAVINEASRFREESWEAIRTTLTKTRGPIRIMGNLKGKKNWFYKMSRRAEAGEEDTFYAKFVSAQAIAAGIIDAAEVESARRDLPDLVFRELYLGEATEDGSNPFGIEAIRAQVGELSKNPPVCFGIDLAKSRDWTVVIGLDAEGSVCRFFHWQKAWLETIADIRTEVKSLPALVDSTGVGDPVLEALQRDGNNNFEGYNFSSASKQKLMEGLAVAIQRGEVGYPDGIIVSELEAFEFQYTGRSGNSTGVRYGAPDGMHDDAVCALALAVSCRSGSARAPRWLPV
jgi:hypothetical protein